MINACSSFPFRCFNSQHCELKFMQEPEAMLSYNPSVGFLAANRPGCQQFLPDRGFPSFPFKCKLHTGQIGWNMHFFLVSQPFSLNHSCLARSLSHRLLHLLDCSSGIVKITIWLTVMKMYPTALKQSLSTFLGRLLISAVLFLKDTEFLKDAETDRGWSLKQCLCARSPESQVQISCRATGRASIATFFVHHLLAVWCFGGKCYSYRVWST